MLVSFIYPFVWIQTKPNIPFCVHYVVSAHSCLKDTCLVQFVSALLHPRCPKMRKLQPERHDPEWHCTFPSALMVLSVKQIYHYCMHSNIWSTELAKIFILCDTEPRRELDMSIHDKRYNSFILWLLCLKLLDKNILQINRTKTNVLHINRTLSKVAITNNLLNLLKSN